MRAADDVVAVGQGRHAQADRSVVGGGADEAVGGWRRLPVMPAVPLPHVAAPASAAVAPLSQYGLLDHVVAVAQGRHSAGCRPGVAGAVPTRLLALATLPVTPVGAAAPRHRPGVGGRAPLFQPGLVDHVVAVGQGRRRARSRPVVARARADQAVAALDDAAADAGGRRCPTSPRPALAAVAAVVPAGAADHVVAVGQGRHAVCADLVVGGACRRGCWRR